MATSKLEKENAFFLRKKYNDFEKVSKDLCHLDVDSVKAAQKITRARNDSFYELLKKNGVVLDKSVVLVTGPIPVIKYNMPSKHFNFFAPKEYERV